MPYIPPKKANFEKLSRLLRGYATAPTLADKVGCSAPTMRRKLENPELFTLDDLKKLNQRMHIPKEEIMEALTF